jgi:cysteinyl-tRNA synthetase
MMHLLERSFIFAGVGLVLSVPVAGAGPEKPFAPESMAYLLQAEGLGKRAIAVDKLTACGRDLLVIDYAYYGDAETRWTREELDRIRSGKPGRRVVAYSSIGEAGTYRFYWQKEWDADGDGKPDKQAPPWLMEANPDWPDNYKVRYWDPAWKKLVKGHLDQILSQGFDGIYLDLVDAFEHFEHDPDTKRWLDHRRNPESGNTYRQDMVAWVREIAEHGRKTRPGFLVIPQNGIQLLEDPDYLKTVDAVGVEDLFTRGNRVQRTKNTQYRASFLTPALNANKPILVIEYSKKEPVAQHAITQAKQLGLRLLITDRPLKTLGRCPLR